MVPFGVLQLRSTLLKKDGPHELMKDSPGIPVSRSGKLSGVMGLQGRSCCPSSVQLAANLTLV